VSRNGDDALAKILGEGRRSGDPNWIEGQRGGEVPTRALTTEEKKAQGGNRQGALDSCPIETERRKEGSGAPAMACHAEEEG
jgi:hypothetical protein